MKTARSLAAFGLAGLLAACATPSADLLLHNAKVLTVDENFSIASAVAVSDGEIVAVGGEELATTYANAGTVIDLGGRVLMPGFTDTHIHVRGQSHRAVELSNATSIGELQALVAAKAEELGSGEWITGYGWDEAKFAEKRNPIAADLDAAAPHNPVALTRAGGHSIVGNTLAMEIAGITSETPQPPAGLIEYDDSGEPNGVIREANDLYLAFVPPDTWEDIRPDFIARLRALTSLGITSIIEASGSIDDEPVGQGGVETPDSGNTYRRIREIYDGPDGEGLPRVAMYISYPGEERLRAYPHATGYGDEWVRIGPIGETAVDGGFTGPTAWTLADYKGQPGFQGRGRFTDEELQEIVDVSGELGWQMGLHAIGDAAIVQTVNAYSASLRSAGKVESDHRWFLDHFTIMPPDETMQIMAEDTIMIAQQPNFTYTLEDRYKQTLDDWRVAHSNSVATPAHKFGLFVALGSDNLPIGPMYGLYTAVTRKGVSGDVLGAEEAITIEEAITMYTANGPYLTFEEARKGTIEVGKFADMIVLDSDLLTIPADDILQVQVDYTIIGGEVVYERAP